MKLRITSVLLALISIAGVNAQKPILTSEDSLKVGSNKLPGISVVIPEIEYEKTLKNWIKVQESGTRSKVIAEGGGLSIFGASVKSLSENPINIYSILRDRDSVLYLTVAIELKKDVYIERATGETELAKGRSFLFDFAKDQYVELANDQYKVEENKLKDLQKDLSSLKKDQTGMEKGIRSGNKLISSEQERLIVLNNELTTLSAAIIEHNKEYNAMEPGELKEEKAKYIKGLEKQKKKALKDIRIAENKIGKAENSINNANRTIPRIDDNQERIRRRISDQEAVVQKFADKLNTIRGFK